MNVSRLFPLAPVLVLGAFVTACASSDHDVPSYDDVGNPHGENHSERIATALGGAHTFFEGCPEGTSITSARELLDQGFQSLDGHNFINEGDLFKEQLWTRVDPFDPDSPQLHLDTTWKYTVRNLDSEQLCEVVAGQGAAKGVFVERFNL